MAVCWDVCSRTLVRCVQWGALAGGVVTSVVSAGCSEDADEQRPTATGGADTGGQVGTAGRVGTGGQGDTGGRVAGGGAGGQGGNGGQEEGGEGGAGFDCAALSAEYAAAADEATSCHPGNDSCSQELFVGIECGCWTFANGERTEAIDRLAEISALYLASGCSLPVSCGMCVEPDDGYCASDGRCRDVSENARDCEQRDAFCQDGLCLTNICG